MKNGKHVLGYLVVILLTFYATKTYFCTTTTAPKDPPTVDIPQPKGIISLENAAELYQNYTNNRACPIEFIEQEANSEIRQKCGIATASQPEFSAARSVYFSKEYLDSYLKYVQQETKKEAIEITGYRFYFANYSDSKQFADGRRIKSPRKNTFFFAPTIFSKEKNMNVGITLTDDGYGGAKPQILEHYFEELDFKKRAPKKQINTSGFFTTTIKFGYGLIGNDVGSYP